MALRKMLAKRLADGYSAKTPAVTLEHSPISSASHSLHAICPPNAAKTKFHREYLTSPESVEKGFFRRFLHRRAMSQLPEFLSLPVGEKLRERLKDINITGCRIRLDGLAPPALEPEGKLLGVSVQDAKKLLKLSQLEKLKAKLREIPRTSISYSEFVRVCVQECGNHDQGLEFANTLDHSGNVIVLGNLVCLRPEQVAKTMENAISQSIATPDDPRREQLEYMERQKGLIDQKARSLVRAELYCGLGFLLVQTLGFMRLTFWELSWDVMEPICFFVTSLHFALAYAFFLRTSTEPSFEGYFQRRFKAKQKKLMELHNFDVRKYNELCKLFYPFNGFRSTQVEHYQPLCQEEGCFASLK